MHTANAQTRKQYLRKYSAIKTLNILMQCDVFTANAGNRCTALNRSACRHRLLNFSSLSFHLACSSSALTSTVAQADYAKVTDLATVTVMGLASASVSSVTLNGNALPMGDWSFDAGAQLLTVSGLTQSLLTAFTLQWSA